VTKYITFNFEIKRELTYKRKELRENYLNKNIHRWELITSPGDNRKKMKMKIK
jgi:hypothetical protein